MNAAQAAISGAALLENSASETNPNPKTGWDYFERVLPSAPIVCGLKLKPLSVGRYRRLRRQNSAFVSDAPFAGQHSDLVGDLLQGLLICSMTCEDYDNFLAQSDVERQIKRFAQQQGFLRERYHDWPIIGKWFVKYIVTEPVQQMRDERAAAYLVEQVELFSRYIADAQRIPNYSRKDNSPSRQTLHWSNSIELHLRSEQNWTTAEIEEAPLSKALADYFGYAESHGMISIHTDADKETAEANAKAITALLAALEKQKPKTE